MSVTVQSSPDIQVEVVGQSAVAVTVVHGAPGSPGAPGSAGPTEVSTDSGNEATLGTDGLLYVGAMRLREIDILTSTRTLSPLTGAWRWLHIRMVAGGGGGGGSSVNSRAGQAGAGGGAGDFWIKQETWNAQLAAWLAAHPTINIYDLHLTVGAGGVGGAPGSNGNDGGDSVLVLRGFQGLNPVAVVTLATATKGLGGRAANASISGFGSGGFGSINTDWAVGITVKGDGGDGRATLNAETGSRGGRSMLGGGGDPGPADGTGGNALGYGGGGGSGARSSSGSNGGGGDGAPGVLIMEVYD